MCTQQGAGKRVGGTFDSHVSSTSAPARPFAVRQRMPNLLSGASLSAILPHRIARLPPASAIRMQATRAACSATPGARRATLCPHWTPLSPSLAQQHITAINHGHASFGPSAPVTAPRPSTGPSSLYKTPALLCTRGNKSPPPPPDIGPAMLMTQSSCLPPRAGSAQAHERRDPVNASRGGLRRDLKRAD